MSGAFATAVRHTAPGTGYDRSHVALSRLSVGILPSPQTGRSESGSGLNVSSLRTPATVVLLSLAQLNESR
jgi:hypothetical protein